MSAAGVRAQAPPAEAGIERYSLFERILHWVVALTFIYLMLSGLALAYPRMAWLYDVLGGGQTVRFLHPVAGLVFTAGVLVMLVVWGRDMRIEAVDRAWVARVREYAARGHMELDIGRYNAGQKGYFWFSVVTALALLVTGLALWFPATFSSTGAAGAARPVWVLHWSRVVHHVVFLLTVGGFVVHVYMSTVMLPGTMRAMTTGRVSRAWAAWHHPRWFREHDRGGPGADRSPSGDAA